MHRTCIGAPLVGGKRGRNPRHDVNTKEASKAPRAVEAYRDACDVKKKRKKKDQFVATNERNTWHVSFFFFFFLERVNGEEGAFVSMKDLRIRVVPWSGVPAFRHTLSRSVALASTRDETRRRLSRVILPPWIFRVDPMEITLYREFLSFREGQVRKKKNKK